MKQTLTTAQAINILLADPFSSWSYNGARALVKFLEAYEEDCGEEQEFDVVALRCEWTEYASAVEAAEDWRWIWLNVDDLSGDDEEEAKEECALEFMQGKTRVLTFDGGVIVCNI